MKVNKIITGLILLIIIGLIAVNIYHFVVRESNKIAFVRTSTVLEKYAGFIEAQQIVHSKSQQIQQIIDSVHNEYSILLENFEKENKGWSETKRDAQIKILQNKKSSIEYYENQMNEKLNSENENTIQGALNQINSFVKEYAEMNNIDIVIGVTISGNVLYGADKIDITELVISELNKRYKGN